MHLGRGTCLLPYHKAEEIWPNRDRHDGPPPDKPRKGNGEQPSDEPQDSHAGIHMDASGVDLSFHLPSEDECVNSERCHRENDAFACSR